METSAAPSKASVEMADDEKNSAPDFSKYGEDSVPPEEREIKHTHPGRPDLDYDDTPVGPAEGAEPAGDN